MLDVTILSKFDAGRVTVPKVAKAIVIACWTADAVMVAEKGKQTFRG